MRPGVSRHPYRSPRASNQKRCLLGRRSCYGERTPVRLWGCGVGPHCSFCGTFTGPFSEVEGLFTVLICIPCLEVRLAQPDTLLGLHDPGSLGSSGAVRSRAVASGSSDPGTWRGTPRPSIPAGRPPTSCCGPIRTSAGGSCTAAVHRRRADPSGRPAMPPRPPRGPRRRLGRPVVDDLQDLDEAEGGPQPPQAAS
jgi:hypothetical protein